MKIIQLIAGAALVVAAVIHVGCATATDADGATYWELGSNLDELPGVYVIYKGSTSASVREMLGEPSAIRRSRKDPAVEEWIYDRDVHFGLEMKGMNAGRGRITALQKQRLREIAQFEIKDGVVQHVAISRIRNDDGIDPIHR